MAWEHLIAKEFKQRNNPNVSPVFTGTVVDNENITVSCFDGQVLLDRKRLLVPVRKKKVLIPDTQDQYYYETEPFACEQGDTVMLCGNLFGGVSGSEKIVLIGVVE